jgi:hypothetical protein
MHSAPSFAPERRREEIFVTYSRFTPLALWIVVLVALLLVAPLGFAWLAYAYVPTVPALTPFAFVVGLAFDIATAFS